MLAPEERSITRVLLCGWLFVWKWEGGPGGGGGSGKAGKGVCVAVFWNCSCGWARWGLRILDRSLV